MGVMRFQVHPPELLTNWPEGHRAYISGADGRVFPTRVEFDGDHMICRRRTSDSGKMHVAWPVAGFGRPVLSTASLPEREQPYLLPLELARGKIVQVRNQLSAWEMAGMAVPDDFEPLHREAHRLLGKAAARQNVPAEAGDLAVEALDQACQAAEVLIRGYTRQRLAVRGQRFRQLPASLGCNLGRLAPDENPEGSAMFCRAFNAATIPIEWRHVEPVEGEYHWELHDAQVDWCQQHKLLMTGGPLLDLGADGLPAWLRQWEGDRFNLQSFICDFVETAIARYLGRIRNWTIAARTNTGGALALNEEDRLNLVARTLETAKQVDEEIQLFVRVDQPWGEYQARGQHRLSPLQFVDALGRFGASLSGIELAINVGYHPGGSALRDAFEMSRLIDRWSSLGFPVHVSLAFPSAEKLDPRAASDREVDEHGWRTGWSEQGQVEWLDLHLPLLMAKPAVVGINWAHFSDAVPHEWPHAGLLRPDGTAKPALHHVIKYRRAYWQSEDGQQKTES